MKSKKKLVKMAKKILREYQALEADLQRTAQYSSSEMGDYDEDETVKEMLARWKREDEEWAKHVHAEFDLMIADIHSIYSTPQQLQAAARPESSGTDDYFTAQYKPGEGIVASKLALPKFKGVEFTAGRNGFHLGIKFGH